MTTDFPLEILDEGETRLVRARHQGRLIERRTRYPRELIELIFARRGPAFVCNEIARDEDEHYVAWELRHDLLAYVDPESMRGRRVLDFGCGAGASSMILARLLPGAQIVGIELEAPSLEIARARQAFHQYANIQFLQSPSGSELPPGLGRFPLIVFSAVFEHLLPAERPAILAQIWDLLEPGGIAILDQTPHRFWPIEKHTTGLPLINFLPLPLAAACARRFSRRVPAGSSTEALLRAGLRGGTAREILGLLRAQGHRPRLLKPSRLGLRTHADLWYAITIKTRPSRIKRTLKSVLAALETCGLIYTPALSLALQKPRDE